MTKTLKYITLLCLAIANNVFACNEPVAPAVGAKIRVEISDIGNKYVYQVDVYFDSKYKGAIANDLYFFWLKDDSELKTSIWKRENISNINVKFWEAEGVSTSRFSIPKELVGHAGLQAYYSDPSCHVMEYFSSVKIEHNKSLKDAP